MTQNLNSANQFDRDTVVFESGLDCDAFESELNEALDLRQDPTANARLMAHVASCVACEQLMQEYVLVDDSMKLLKGEVDEILARTAARSRAHSRLKLVSGLSLVALLMLMCLAIVPKMLQPKTVSITIAELSPEEIASVGHPDIDAQPMVRVLPSDAKSLGEQKEAGSLTPSQSTPMEPIDIDIKAAMSGDFNALGEQVQLEPGAWEMITSQFQQLEPMMRYSELPGPMRGTVSITWELIKRTFTASKEQ